MDQCTISLLSILDTMPSPCPQKQTKTKTPNKVYRTLLARQRKRVQRLRQTLNKKKERHKQESSFGSTTNCAS